jgi:Trk-type K+ transport system membrane component
MADRAREAPQASLTLAFAVYFALLAGGVVYLRFFALETGMAMNWDRSLFWAANALTLTGFRIAPDGLADFSAAGVFGVYVLMVAGALYALIVGGSLVCRFAGLPHSRMRIVVSAVFLLLVASLAGAGMVMTKERSLGASRFEATGAIANCGISLDEPRPLDDWRLHLVILPLAALGGLGLPVLMDLFDRIVAGKPISTYSQRVLRLFVVAWLVGLTLLLFANHTMPWRQNVLTSWTYAINSRSLGADLALSSGLPRLTWWIIGGLMLIGQMPGGTASGVRLLPLSTIWHADDADGNVSGPALTRAVTWVTLYALMAILMFLLLMSVEPQISTDRLVAISSGAIGNCGLSQDALALSSRGLLLMSGGMLAGYLLPLRFMGSIIDTNGTLEK